VFPCDPCGSSFWVFITNEPLDDHRRFLNIVLLMDEEEDMASPAIVPTPRVNQVSGAIVNSAMKVHSLLGPGLLESAYDACLTHELRKRGFRVETQVGLPVVYDGGET
jgi:hypothetical protein